MTDKRKQKPPAVTPERPAASAARRAREAEALRRNLRRRKAPNPKAGA